MAAPEFSPETRSYADVLFDTTALLRHVSDTPRLDAEILLAHCLGIGRARLLASLREESEILEKFEALVERRRKGEPIAYILGKWEFYSLEFEIEKPVLVPRPETELLVETVLDFAGQRDVRILEIGTGSGCIAATIASKASRSRIVATDIREGNLLLASRNAYRHEVNHRIEFRHGDMFQALDDSDRRFDIVCSNPPYVKESDWNKLSPTIRNFEDPCALVSGSDGLDAVRQLVAGAPKHLKPGGLLAFEIGIDQSETVQALLHDAKYTRIDTMQDLSGIDRVAVARIPA